METSSIINYFKVIGVKYGLSFVGALAIFFIGRWVSKLLKKLLRDTLVKGKVEDTLISFVCNITYAVLMTITIIASLNRLGVQTASLVAVMGAAGLAIGLALQGSLSNFAAGVLLILFKPFSAGHFIEASGVSGIVEEIDIFTTSLRTPDNKSVIVPNAQIYSGNIVNYSSKDTRRVDLIIGVGYQDNLAQVKEELWDLVKSDERILPEPEPTIGIVELADSSVNFALRPWVKTSDYWPVYMDLLEKIKVRFDDKGISIPFPQRDVHLYSETSAS